MSQGSGLVILALAIAAGSAMISWQLNGIAHRPTEVGECTRLVAQYVASRNMAADELPRLYASFCTFKG